MIREYAGRKLHSGDLVLYLYSKGYITDMQYGIIISSDKIFNGNKELTISSCYLAGMSDSEVQKKEKLVKLYNEKLNKDILKKERKKENQVIGEVYCYKDKHNLPRYELYLGKFNVWNNILNTSQNVLLYVSMQESVYIDFKRKFSSCTCNDDEILDYIFSCRNNLRYDVHNKSIRVSNNKSCDIIMQKTPHLLDGELCDKIDIITRNDCNDIYVTCQIKRMFSDEFYPFRFKFVRL